jgi:hypothetical protein
VRWQLPRKLAEIWMQWKQARIECAIVAICNSNCQRNAFDI